MDKADQERQLVINKLIVKIQALKVQKYNQMRKVAPDLRLVSNKDI